MSQPLVWILALVVVLAIGIPLTLYVRRRSYVNSLESRGWRFVERPGLDAVHGLNVPPFGIGLDRKVDDLVEGTTQQGVPFRVVEYSSSEAEEQRVAMLGLRGVHDPAFIAPAGTLRPRAGGYDMGTVNGLAVYATDSRDTNLAPSLAGVLPATLGPAPTNLAIDGQWLTATGCPERPEEIAAFVEALAPVALAIDSRPTSTSWVVPAELSFYGRPDIVYRDRDDAFLERVDHARGGQNHAAVNVMFSDNAGLPIVGLTHTWETTRTETRRDPDGRTKTRTITEHHAQPIVEALLPHPFVPLKVRDHGVFGPSHKVQFESVDFDRRYEIGCEDARFASNVFHPRMMEFFLASQPPPFTVADGRIRFHLDTTPVLPDTLAGCADFVHGFLGRVPSFVWRDLGVEPPAFRVLERE